MMMRNSKNISQALVPSLTVGQLEILKSLTPRRLLGGKFVSKWIVLLIDLCLIATSLLIAYTLQTKLAVYALSFIDYYKALIGVLIFSLIGHLLFRPHEGIIRHTGIYDIKVLFFARSLSLMLNLTFIGFVAPRLHWDAYAVPFNVAAIHYFLSLYLLIQFRLGIRFIFNQGKRARRKPKIIIYGSGESGRLTYDAVSPFYDVTAFLDDNSSLKGKILKGIKILNFDTDMDTLVEKYDISQLIISIQNISSYKKREIIDKCLKYKVEVKVVPPIDHWLNGQLTTAQIKNVKIEQLLGRDVITLNKDIIASEVNGKHILVTGAAGSIGSELVRQILKFSPAHVILLDQAETPLHNLELEIRKQVNDKNIQCTALLADIRDQVLLRKVFTDYPIEIIFHAAAYKHVPAIELNPLQALQVNILGTRNVADLADEFGVQKMVFISTDKAVNPTNVMGATKRVAEMYVQSKNKISQTAYITTRFGNVLGSNGSVIPLFKRQIEQGGPITVTHPDVTRYFMTIPEACQLVLDAGVMGKGGEIFVFDMGDSVKIVDLAEKMIQLSGLTPGKDIKIEFTGLRPGEKLYEELLNDQESILPTHHDKIMIARVIEYEYTKISQSIIEMEQKARLSPDNHEMVLMLKYLVPEYISQNSPYDHLVADLKMAPALAR
jgi:FlaA1/EpsC-like NDP-sugar epimerase